MFAPRLLATALLSLVMLSGCTTTVHPLATGGSKSDGIVEMSYEYSPYTVPEVNTNTANYRARRRCQTWGYDDVEAFDAGLTTCSQPSFGGCNMWRVTTQYQCIHTDGENQAALSDPETDASPKKNYREELRQIQDSMSCNNGAKIVSQSEESVKWELDCGDGETLSVRCFEDDCYLR